MFFSILITLSVIKFTFFNREMISGNIQNRAEGARFELARGLPSNGFSRLWRDPARGRWQDMILAEARGFEPLRPLRA